MRTKITTWQSPLTLISAALIALLLLYSNGFTTLVTHWWNSSDYSHGILLPFITLYLIWLKRLPLANAETSAQPAGVILLLILSIGWLCAKTINIQAIEQLTLIALIPTLVWTLLGNDKTKIILFPLGYLFFAAPVWDLLIVPLQNLTALASFNILRLTNLPILLEEHHISIPAGKFLIAKACGGLRFFIAAAAISSLYAYLNYQSISRRLIFISIALLGATILNWIRVCIIIWIGQLTNMQHPLVEDHNSLGWSLFAVALIPLFYFGAKFKEPTTDEALKANHTQKKSSSLTYTITFAAAILVLSTPPIILYLIDKPAQTTSQSKPLPQPSNINWNPVFIGADNQSTKTFSESGANIHLHISHYSKQTQGAELINELNTIYNKENWRKTDEQSKSLNLAPPLPGSIHELQLEDRRQHKRLIWHWYRVAGITTANATYAKLLELRKLIGNRQGSAIIAMAIDYDDEISTDKARDHLIAFLKKEHLAIESAFNQKLDEK